MQEPPLQPPKPLVRTYLYVIATVIGGVGGIGFWLGTELWHLALGAPLLLMAGGLIRLARHAG